MRKLNKNVLVTGGAGFIGSHVALELKTWGYQVIVLDDLSGGFKENIPDGVEFVQGSIIDHVLLADLFSRRKFDYVFHFAAYAAEGLSHFIKRFNYTNNVIGSVNLINEAVKNNVKCFVFSSSLAVYGNNRLPLTEDLVPVPEDSYGVAKLAVELELKISHQMFGLNYIIFRLHNVYGENQNIGDKYRNVIGVFMNNIMRGQPMTIFGDGQQTRAFTHIADVASLMARSIDYPSCYGEIFNAGADKPYSVNELAQEVMDAMGKKTEIVYTAQRNEVKHVYGDHTKLKKIFSDHGKVNLQEGVRRMAQWAQKVGVRQSKEFKDIEIHKNLPRSWVNP